jgi:hypothetical protein
MSLFRIHIRPSGGAAYHKTTFDFCMKEGVLGVGWRTVSNRSTKNWDEYYDEASTTHKDLNVCKYIYKRVNAGDLAWTRDSFGSYLLARVNSGWEYWTTEESRRLDIDIANIFRCELKRVEIDEVPGKIVACFRSRKSIQEIADEKACEYSRHLWNKLSGQSVYQTGITQYPDIFMMLDDEETEDLLFLYLQSKGWYVVPNSRKGDTMSFEYLCVNPLTGEVAGTQVKTGNAPLDMNTFASVPHKTFLFQANDRYLGTRAANVETVTRTELMGFIEKSAVWLPRAFRRKIEIVNLRTVSPSQGNAPPS